MNFIIHGAAGRMGGNLIASVEKSGHTVAACVDILYADAAKKNPDYPCFASIDACDVSADCIIDFSNHVTTIPLLTYATEKKIPVMLATTGQTEDEKAAITAAADKIPLFRAANMSLGIATLVSLVKTAVCMFPDADIEIIEKHHNRKKDAPSGTAISLANDILAKVERKSAWVNEPTTEADAIEITSLREGTVPGTHTVTYTSEDDKIEIKHTLFSRRALALGAVVAAEFIAPRKGVFTIDDLFE